MKAGIVGAGALGSLFAHVFQRAGIAFSLYEKNKSVVDAIYKSGLTFFDGEKSETIHPMISTTPGILADADIILLFVKSYSTEDAIQSIKGAMKKDSVVVSLQNGLGNYETIAKYIDENHIVLGTTTIGATKTDQSTVELGGKGSITIGSVSAESVEAADALLTKTGLPLQRIFNPHIAVWKKAIINSGINPIASILNIRNGEILDSMYSMTLQESVIKEGVNTAGSAGIQLDLNTMISEVKDVCVKTSSNICSMLQDIRNSRRTEIDSINGAIMKFAAEKGIHVPVTETLYSLVKCIEAKNSTE